MLTTSAGNHNAFPPSIFANREMLNSLAERGLHNPIRSIEDPRARLPELLMTSGWQRQANSDSVTYSQSLQDTFEPSSTHSSGQSIEFCQDHSKILTTRVDEFCQSIIIRPDGTINELTNAVRR